jgi:GrpB-like predicted nucleotidyltransferase (UPF0157 family)
MALERRLAAEHDRIDAYAEAKPAFIADLLDRARTC